MSASRPFAQVDVFTSTPYLGNPVAVVLDGHGLDDAAMQRFARWTNLSETTFVLPPDDPGADYRLRIFTPGGELPFAGHPTLGSAHAWLEHGGRPRDPGVLVQQCTAGLVRVHRHGASWAFEAPPTVRDGALDDTDLVPLLAALGLARQAVVAHQWVDNGPGWAVVQVRTAQEVLDLEPDLSLAPTAMVGVIGAHPRGAGPAFELRAFAPRLGVPEDPVTGSLNASVAQWLARTGAAPGPRYRVRQGTRLGRDGDVHVTVHPRGGVRVGGGCVTCVRGVVAL